MLAVCCQLHNYDVFEKAQLKLSPLIQNRVEQDYLPESYTKHLRSYQKCHKIVAPTRCGLFPFPWTFMGNPGDGEKPYPTAKNLLISPIRKFPLNRFKSFAIKSFIFSLPIKQQFSSNHPMQSSFEAVVISVVSYFKFQAFCTHMSC